MLFLWLYGNPVTIRGILAFPVDYKGELQENPVFRLRRVSVALYNSPL